MASQNIRMGSMFLQRDISLPQALELETSAYSRDWKIVNGLDSYSFGVKMRSIGWRLIFVAGHVEVMQFGWDRQSGARRGAKRMLKRVRALHLNCMELAGVLRKRFLGIPYMVVSGDTYHVQKNMELESSEQRSQPKVSAA